MVKAAVPNPNSLLAQASRRLLVSLVMLALLGGFLGSWFYVAALKKTVHHDTLEVVQHYTAKMAGVEENWEKEAVELKSRLEFYRVLDDPRSRWDKLRGDLTIQGENRIFANVMVTSQNGRVLFQFGTDMPEFPDTMPKGFAGWFYHAQSGSLFRVYRQPLWLAGQGEGRLVTFKKLDNALLYRSAFPNTVLSLKWRTYPVASSLGGRTTDQAQQPDGQHFESMELVEQASFSWPGRSQDSPLLVMQRRHSASLFSLPQLALAGLTIFAVLVILLWFSLGKWLMKITRRIASLGNASRQFTRDALLSAPLKALLDASKNPTGDEISEVAHSFEALILSVRLREQERNAAEMAVCESEKRFRLLFNGVDDAIFVVAIHPDGSPGRFIEANETACRRLGYSREELLALSLRDVNISEDMAESAKILKKILEEGHALFERTHVAKNGRRIPVEVSAHRFTLEGRTAILGVARDISERLMAQRSRQQIAMEPLQRLNIATEMTFGLTHELSQPIAAAHTYLDAALRWLENGGYEPDKQLKCVSLARQQTERAGNVINRFKRLVRQEGGERSHVDLNQLIRNAVDFLGYEINRSAITVYFDLEALPAVFVRSVEIEQVLLNLLKNAVEAMQESAVRELRLRSRHNEDDGVLVDVSDTGKGVSVADMQAIFEQFHTTKSSGLGLGLSICQTIIESHEGRVWAESVVGQGAKFSFVLPG